MAIEMCEHRGAVDVEAGDELGYGVPFLVCGDQLLDVSASEPALGLSVARSDPPGGLRKDVSQAPEIENSLSQTCTKSLPGFESRPIRSTDVVDLTALVVSSGAARGGSVLPAKRRGEPERGLCRADSLNEGDWRRWPES